MTLSIVPRVAPAPTLPPVNAPVAAYVSKFQLALQRGRWVALAALAVWALSWFFALRSADVATRVIGHDTAPSITAAERIRTLLSDANGNLANIMLTRDNSGAFLNAFNTDIADAEAKLVDAAENITYGDAERIPIVNIALGLAQYEEIVGQARANNSAEAAMKADGLMRDKILPATEALDKANDDQLTARYQEFLDTKAKLQGLALLLSLGAVGLFGFAQYEMFRTVKRIVNPGLAAASLIVVLFSLVALAAVASADAELKTAKSDAFDSIYALTNLQAVANDANAAESYWLLGYGDPHRRLGYQYLFGSLSKQIVGIDLKDAMGDEAAHRKFPGFLGDELSNITFDGEREAAEATLKAWAAYLAIDRRLRELQNAGKGDDAIALDVGAQPGQSNWAFDRFQKALEQTIKINQDAFDAAILASERGINFTVYGALLAAWLIASAATWHGFRQRLREYEI